MTGRSRFWISYLTLTLVIVGAAAHGFLSQAAQRLQRAGAAFSEGTTLTDGGTLPTLRAARPLTDARKSRLSQSGKADDSDTLPATVAAKRRSTLPTTFLPQDLGRTLSAATRATHRPRDPPALI